MTLTYRDVAKDKITGQQGKGGPSTGSSLYDEQEHDHASPSLTIPFLAPTTTPYWTCEVTCLFNLHT